MVRGQVFLIAMALVMTLTMAIGPSYALARSGDVAATHTYIQANYTLVQAGTAHLGAAKQALQTLERQIEGECPRGAVASPQNTDSTQLSDEVIGAMVLGAYNTDISAGLRFIRVTKNLHWSNPKLTNTIRSYVAKLKVLSTLTAPNVCADIKAWAASGYRTLPESTIQFDKQFMPNWVAIGESPIRLLAPYKQPTQTATLRRTTQLESRITEFEAEDGVETWGRIMDGLVLQP
jgi:hypothetical protein